MLTVLHDASQDLLRNTYPAEHVLLADNDGNPEIEEKVEIIEEKPGENNLSDEVDTNKENESGEEDSEEYCGKSGNNLTKNR